MRWARPDLTAALADQVLEETSAAGEQDRWLVAAGWAVHARSATGDGRRIACDVLTGVKQWGSEALTAPAAHRLRVELAMVAAGAGEVQSARDLIAPVSTGGRYPRDPELRADLLCVRARCAVEDESDDVTDALDAAASAWAAVGGNAGEIGGASVDLIKAVVERRAGRPDAAVDRAADGLARLERGRGRSGKPSAHLAAALAAEWISALLDAGRSAEAGEGCGALLPRLSEQARPSRQLALLRLTVARAVAGDHTAADSAKLLEQAAEDAAASDVPDLEAVCRTALGALHEQASRLEIALENLQLGVAAERRHRSRSRRFAAALAELPREAVRPEPRPAPEADRNASVSDAETTTLLPLITRGDRKLANSRRSEDRLRSGERAADPPAGPPADAVRDARRRAAGSAGRERSRFQRLLEDGPPGPAENGEPDTDEPGGWGAVPWDGSTGESPIGDLLLRSLRSQSDRDGGAAPRNGKPVGDRSTGERAGRDGASRAVSGDDSAAGSATGRAARRRSAAERSDQPTASGWIPALDSDRQDERPRRRRGSGRRSRSDDAGRTRARGASADSASGAGDGIARLTSSGGGARHRDSDTATRHLAAHTRDEEARPGPRERGEEDGPERHRSDERQGSGRRSRRTGRDRADATGGLDGTRGRPDGAGSGDMAGGSGLQDATETPARSGHRHRADDPWATGRWPAEPVDRSAEPVRAENPGAGAADVPAAGSSTAAGDDADGWLSAALADLDRALSGVGVGEPAASEPALEHDACTVVIDIARDARRFAGPRAGSVIRGVADRLSDRLPSAAELRFGEMDTLEISGSRWTRADATDWMHRTLPGLLDGFVADEDLPGAQLRAAVHDTDGPVGAQILQNLARPAARRREPEPGNRPGGAERDRNPWGDLTDQASEARAREYRVAARSGRTSRAERARSGRSRRDAEPEQVEHRDHDDGPRGWPWSGEGGLADPADPVDGAAAAAGDERGPDQRSAAASGPAGDTNGRTADPAGVLGRVRGADTTGRHGDGRSGARPGSEDEARAAREDADGATGESEGHGTGGSRRGAADSDDSRATGSGRCGGTSGADNTARTDRSNGRRTNGAAVAGSLPTGDDQDRTAGRPDGAPETAESTEGLGIADLLAGALAAYRGI